MLKPTVGTNTCNAFIPLRLGLNFVHVSPNTNAYATTINKNNTFITHILCFIFESTRANVDNL